MSIRCILSARIMRYTDTRQVMAHVLHLDQRNRQGETVGNPRGAHMQALLLRALREGVTVTREEF